MRYKVVPPVRDLAFLRAVAGALPLVPGTVDDCCSRIVDRTDVAARDDAREWLTFCQALGLAAETERGYHRVRDDPDDAALADAFEERVFGAREVLDAATDGVTTEAAFADVRDLVPNWERARDEEWEKTWRERTRRLLDWATVLGHLEREGGVYRRPGG